MATHLGLEIDVFGTGTADDDGWPILIGGSIIAVGDAFIDIIKVKSDIEPPPI